ncbi:3-methyl-2-oxobutanoate hydroxymethyltransferase [Salisediminibacterium halotolerans]|uniref:3-methyl-2-oxobutanoate hydroxymethyltransferase n=1 Tax=Salisediminibacterium halotolerans TaxID=517425 RepID=A0A1H9P042_9BACI|nr:3-methyl-2-oxobutanoate hydroxymethyltransferase [Salisediminibacterium haloalkalitolerans]SER41491.1 3-methyl-2-oxobutanoate hydroxymethyltransferase [Salisediminibacterium haloalkalitolerans]
MKTTAAFKQMKEKKEPIVMLTAYDAPSAAAAEGGGADVILVGDSLGMVVLGYESTVPVTMDDMVHHTKAVRRGAKDTFVITDMPFMTYHGDISETISHARRLMQEASAHAVKLEGGGEVIDHIARLVSGGVPVAAHLGLTPQSVGVLGGYKVQGKDKAEREALLTDAARAEKAGASMLVVELIPESLGKELANMLTIPVIGIGAGRYTDGQVLVYHDILRYGAANVPKFVQVYADLNETIQTAVCSFTDDVKTGSFPAAEHVFQPLEPKDNEDGKHS